MDIRFKFNNKSYKIGSNGNWELCDESSKTGEPAYIEANFDFIHKLYKTFAPNMQSYQEEAKKVIDRFMATYKKNPRNTEDTTGQIPVNGHDIYNYVARFGAANFQIQVVMKLDGRLDFEKLKRAVRLSVDVEPVFGCRIAINNPPYWKRLSNIDEIEFCSIEETSDIDEAANRFLEKRLDMDLDPMVKLRLIRAEDSDTLCMKVNHSCCDGTGTKEYLELLSEIYSRLDNNEEYIPVPRVRTRKDQDRLFEALGITDPEAAWDPSLEIPKSMWSFPWNTGKPGMAKIAVMRLPAGQIEVLSNYAKARNATINDLLLTSFYRTYFEMSQPIYGIPMNISGTADLRRYLPDHKTEAIRNFSGGLDTRLARLPGEKFDGTLSRVVKMMNKIKDSNPGLQSAIGLERVERAKFNETLDFYQNAAKFHGYFATCGPVVSNLSYLKKDLFTFGKINALDAYIVPPAVSAPGLLFCVSTYNGILTIATSFYQTQGRPDVIETLLNSVRKGLMSCCE